MIVLLEMSKEEERLPRETGNPPQTSALTTVKVEAAADQAIADCLSD
jgi:hypothetical protein